MPQSVDEQTGKLKRVGDILLTTEEVAERLRVSRRTLEKWRTVGGGPPFIKLNRRAVRYQEEAVEAWKRSRARMSTSDPGRAAS